MGILNLLLLERGFYTLSQEYDIVFIHRIGNIENWIGVTKDLQNLYAFINTPTPVYFNMQIEGDPIYFGTIHDIQQIGNTLSVLTTDGLRYFLWADNTYKYLGGIP